MDSGKLRLTITDLHPWLRCLAFSLDGQILATGGGDPVRKDRALTWVSSEVRLPDVQTGKLLRTIEGKSGETSSLAFSPRGQMVLAADRKRTHGLSFKMRCKGPTSGGSDC
jgi:WD40 repeat protein